MSPRVPSVYARRLVEAALDAWCQRVADGPVDGPMTDGPADPRLDEVRNLGERALCVLEGLDEDHGRRSGSLEAATEAVDQAASLEEDLDGDAFIWGYVAGVLGG